MPNKTLPEKEFSIKEQKIKFFLNNWAVQSALTYKNWWTMYADYLDDSLSQEYVLKTWNFGNYYIRPGTGDITVANEVFIANEYQIEKSKEKMTAIDVGANIGTFTVGWLKANPQGHVFSYEPDKDNFKVLKRNVELNNLLENTTLINSALSQSEGKVDFTVGIKAAGGSTADIDQGDLILGNKKIKVDSVVLQNEIERQKIGLIDFLKIDCEGAEYEILYGLKKSTVDKIKKIVVEAHTLNSGPKTHTPDVLYRHLVARGFKVNRKTIFDYAKTELFVCTRA